MLRFLLVLSAVACGNVARAMWPSEDPGITAPRSVVRGSSELVDLGRMGPLTAPGSCDEEDNAVQIWNFSDVEVPMNTTVSLPANTTVRLKTRVALKSLIIPESSELILEGDLNVTSLVVHGRFRAGTAQCRLESSVTLMVRKIVVTGIFDVHGAEYQTWSRLAMTAESGDTYLLIQDRVNWEIGQTIVVTTTHLKDSRDWHQNEVVRISDVKGASHLGDGVTAVYLSEKLKYRHYAGQEYQSEVGLLSRRIRIQGQAVESEPDTQVCSSPEFSSFPCPDSYSGNGGSVIIEGKGAVARISGVEFYRMGETNVRSALEWNKIKNGMGQYVRDSSFHQSFYHCVALRGTNGVLISRNVAFDINGHCLYLQGERNRIEFNLHSFIHPIGMNPSEEVLSSSNTDATAAGFFIANAKNFIRNNAAVGGFYGFQVTDETRKFKQFDGNSCRSSGFWNNGACIYLGGGGGGGKELTNTKVALAPIAVFGGHRMRLRKFEAHDIYGGPVVLLDASTLKDVLITCDNVAIDPWCDDDCGTSETRFWDAQRTVMQFDAPTILSNATIRNCDPDKWTNCVGLCRESTIFSRGRQESTMWNALTADVRYDGKVDATWLDMDRGIYGPWNLDDDCDEIEKVWRCDARGRLLASFRLNKTATVTRFGSTAIIDEGNHIFGPVATRYSDGIGWFLAFDETPASFELSALQIHPDALLIVAIAYPTTTNFNIQLKNYTYPQVTDVRLLSSQTAYFVDENGVLYIRVVASSWLLTSENLSLPVPSSDRLRISADCTDCSSNGEVPSLLWSASSGAVTSFVLVNAIDETDVLVLQDGDIETDLIDLNIRAVVDTIDVVGSVVFDGLTSRIENHPPYSVFGDVDGDYSSGKLDLDVTYTITATAYAERDGDGDPGPSLTITFTLRRPTSGPSRSTLGPTPVLSPTIPPPVPVPTTAPLAPPPTVSPTTRAPLSPPPTVSPTTRVPLSPTMIPTTKRPQNTTTSSSSKKRRRHFYDAEPPATARYVAGITLPAIVLGVPCSLCWILVWR